jgi:small subunit ribosomal protein S16
MGVTRLRLARFGSRNRPFYHVVATDSRNARDAKPIEQLGTYDPIPFSLDGAKEVRLKVDRVKYWLSVGAQPSERVAYLLWRGGLIEAPPAIHFSPNAWKPKKKNAERAVAALAKKAEKEKAAADGGGATAATGATGAATGGSGETKKASTDKATSPPPKAAAAASSSSSSSKKASFHTLASESQLR